MPIELQDQAPRDRVPVVKRTRIGERFLGAIVKVDQRNVLKDGQPVLKGNGKPRQELVVTAVVLPGTTAPAGIGDQVGVPEAGTLARLILRGKAFGDWIEARKTHRAGSLNVGDFVCQDVTYAQAYDANGQAKGGQVTDQTQAEAIPRGTTVGFYGPITLHEPTDPAWVTAAEEAYHAATAIVLEEQPAAADPWAPAPTPTSPFPPAGSTAPMTPTAPANGPSGQSLI